MGRIAGLLTSGIRGLWLLGIGWWSAALLVGVTIWLARSGRSALAVAAYAWLPSVLVLRGPSTGNVTAEHLESHGDAFVSVAGRLWAAGLRAAGRAWRSPGHGRADVEQADSDGLRDERYWRSEFQKALQLPVRKGHFECRTCGRWIDVASSAAAWGDAIRSRVGVTRSEWQRIRQIMTKEPIRIAHIQRSLGKSYEDAIAILAAATSLEVLVPSGNGFLLGPAACGSCTRSRSTPVVAVADSAGRFEREPIGARLRFLVLQRDGFRCTYCGRSQQDGAILHVDHVVPVVAGGATALENLVTACSSCNLGKSASSVVPPSLH